MWPSFWNVGWVMVLIAQLSLGQMIALNSSTSDSTPLISASSSLVPGSIQVAQSGRSGQSADRQNLAYPEPPDVYDYEAMRQAEKEIYGEDDPGWHWGTSGDALPLEISPLDAPPLNG
jgi:hypothetical protein